MLRFKILASGSAGNATVVQAGDGLQTTTVLVDCGLSLPQLQKRLLQAGLDFSALDAIFITHEHSDHLGNAPALALQYGIPIYMSQGTWLAAGATNCSNLLHFALDQQPLHIGALELKPFTVPHDAREPLQLRCSDGCRSLGFLTDLGHMSEHALSMLSGCNSLLLECNHDETLLKHSKYPSFLRQRIGGAWGHLSNAQACTSLQKLLHPQLKHVVGAHISIQNNTPKLARTALATALGCAANEVLLASQNSGSGWLDV